MKRNLCTILVVHYLLLSMTLASAKPQHASKIILDTDPGVDDAMAILLAINSPEIEIAALTVVAGNVVIEQGLQNALKLVSASKRCDIKVARGASRPLAQRLTTAEFFHGENGLGNISLPAPSCLPDAHFAPDLIIELVSKYPHEITLVPIGPLTNLALAVAKAPAIVPLVKEVVLMGDGTTGGNVTAAAEANINNDPEAAKVVLEAGWPITIVGLNVTEKTLFTRTHLQELAKTQGGMNGLAVPILSFMVHRAESTGLRGTPMHDPLTVGAVIDRSLIESQYLPVKIETRGEYTRGETVINRHGTLERKVQRGDHDAIIGIQKVSPNAHVAVAADAQRFLALFLSRVAGK